MSAAHVSTFSYLKVNVQSWTKVVLVVIFLTFCNFWVPHKRVPKAQASRGRGGMTLVINFFVFNFLKSPFLGLELSLSERILASSILLEWSLATWKVFSLIYLLWKIWPISVKRWKPMWIRAWTETWVSVKLVCAW